MVKVFTKDYKKHLIICIVYRDKVCMYSICVLLEANSFEYLIMKVGYGQND